MAEEFKTPFDQVSSHQIQAVTPNIQLLSLIYGFAAAQAVDVAAKIGLADELSQGPRPSEEVAQARGEDPERTEAQFRPILEAAGFHPNRIIPTKTPRPISEAMIAEAH